MRAFGLREHASSILVAALSSAFGVALLQATGAFAVVIAGDATTGSSGTASGLLVLVALVFIVIAVFVAAQVIANTFGTIIAGRTRSIALMRLLGATARSQRSAVAREGLLVGVIGAAVGAVVGTGVVVVLLEVLTASGVIVRYSYTYTSPVLVLPVVAVVLTTWLAAWAGARPVLVVSPMAATGAAESTGSGESAPRRSRTVGAAVLVGGGLLLILAGVTVGLVSSVGVLVALAGGVLSFSGIVLGAHRVVPPVLRVIGRVMGPGVTARLAAENALRYPQRTSRNAIGLVIGVTLVTMFTVAASMFAATMAAAAEANPGTFDGTQDVVRVITTVFAALTGFSALIAAVGMVNSLSLSVLQRTRELGLLRALGLSSRQVHVVVVLESVQLSVAAVTIGVGLGTFYGWVGAQSLLGSLARGVLAPVLPLPLVLAAATAVLVLTAIASVAPARRATRVSAVAALAVQ